MIRCPTAYLELEGFEPRFGGEALLVGERLFVADEQRLVAVAIDGARREWGLSRARPPPDRYRVPRRIRSGGRRLWAGDGAIAQLFDADDGVVVVGHEATTGREAWRTEILTPPAAPWTEATPAWDGAPTEELHAFLVASDVLAVAVARTTRTGMRSPDRPAPDLRGQLDVVAVERSDGSIAWRATFPDVFVPTLEQACFAGSHVAGRHLFDIDWANGDARALADLPGDPSWPRAIGNRLCVASRSRGTIGVDVFVGGEHRRRGAWRRNGVRALRLFACADRAALQINDQFVVLLSEDLTSPCWEARAKPYVYGVAATSDGPVFVATAGNGGGFYAFDRRNGRVVAEVRIRGGAWDACCVDGTHLIASTCGDGLAVADARDGRVAVVEVPGANAIAGSRGGHVMVLSGAPRPGVHVVDVRRALEGGSR